MARPPTTRTIHERRDATVMLADISGFTALSERTDPERVTEIVNACFERLEATVHFGIAAFESGAQTIDRRALVNDESLLRFNCRPLCIYL